MTGLTYSTYLSEMLVLCQFNADDPNFTTNLPNAITYAEDRINRELNLLSTVVSNSSLALTPGSRRLDFTTAAINVLQDVNVITPAGTTNPDLGTRNPATVVDKAYLNTVYSGPTNLGLPVNFALQDDHTLLFGPFPDAAYTVELIGTMRPVSLSADNPTTWIATNLPDLFIAASMIWMSGFMRNFGSQSDNPQQAVSWETQYVTLRDSAAVEDARRKFQATGWNSELPNAYNPPRT